MADTTYGGPIATNGVRPLWLRDGDDWEWSEGGHVFTKSGYPMNGYIWDDITHIRLLASSPVYTALAAGFEPWRGGEEAPSDWDGDKVLFRDGSKIREPISWRHPWSGGHTEDLSSAYDIIGYRKHAEPAQPTAEPASDCDDEGPCTACWDTGVTIQTERPCTCDAAMPAEPKAELPPEWAIERALEPINAEYFERIEAKDIDRSWLQGSIARLSIIAHARYIAQHETPPDPVGDKARELKRIWDEASDYEGEAWRALAAHVLGVSA